MRLLKVLGIAVVVMLFSLPVYAERFLTSPLQCGDPSCTFQYSKGVYTPGTMNSILDHSLVKNPVSGKWPYVYGNPPLGDNKKVVAFNGEVANGARSSEDPQSYYYDCIGGTINLRPTSGSAPMTNATCGAGFASYDEHPGYDYRATLNTKVKAAAPGKVVRGRCALNGIGNCSDWGYVGIDHGNGYITQYGHLNSVYVSTPGATVYEGQVIGLVGHKGLSENNNHLHFEVLKILGATFTGNNFVVVDPYGWVGNGGDPLTAGSIADPRYAANGVVNSLLWADRCDRLTAADPVATGYGAPYNVFSPYKNVLLKAACTNTTVTFTIGDGSSTQYVYRYAYEWSGTKWSQIALTGTNPSGDWFIGQAQASRSRIASEVGKESSFVAYTCFKEEGSVTKCGCRDSACTTQYWQKQTYK